MLGGKGSSSLLAARRGQPRTQTINQRVAQAAFNFYIKSGPYSASFTSFLLFRALALADLLSKRINGAWYVAPSISSSFTLSVILMYTFCFSLGLYSVLNAR